MIFDLAEVLHCDPTELIGRALLLAPGRGGAGEQRREAASVLANAYHLARLWLKKVGEYELAVAQPRHRPPRRPGNGPPPRRSSRLTPCVSALTRTHGVSLLASPRLPLAALGGVP